MDVLRPDKFNPTFEELIPAAFSGLTGPGNNVNVVGIPGQSPFSIGLGFFPINGTDPSGFNFSSSFSEISVPFCEIISSVLGGNFTAFPLPFPGVDGNSTFPGFGGGTPPSPGLNGTITTLSSPVPSDVASPVEV